MIPSMTHLYLPPLSLNGLLKKGDEFYQLLQVLSGTGGITTPAGHQLIEVAGVDVTELRLLRELGVVVAL